MGGRRSGHDFRRHWHRRQLDHDGRTLTWILIDDPRGARVHAECFRWRNGEGVHHDTARRILTEHGHPDAEHVPTDIVAGTRFH